VFRSFPPSNSALSIPTAAYAADGVVHFVALVVLVAIGAMYRSRFGSNDQDRRSAAKLTLYLLTR
jgi:hypothetical protein